MVSNFNKFLVAGSFFCSFFLGALEKEEQPPKQSFTVNFQDVPAAEFVRYVSRVAGVNFIFNQKELQFPVSLSTGKGVDAEHILKALIRILKVHGMTVVEDEGYLVIRKTSEMAAAESFVPSLPPPPSDQFASITPSILAEPHFLVHKVQYHSGEEIEDAIKKIALDLHSKPSTSPKYLSALQSVQWVKSTNSLVCSGEAEVLSSVKKLIESLDVALRQVFIEVLVIEIDVRKSVEFGLEWAAGAKFKDSLKFGTGNFSPPLKPGQGASPFALAFQDSGHSPVSSSNPFSLGSGFDLGVIGDIILHKGKSYFSLGSLVSALQVDGDSTIVLNQKIITQDNKNSTIFVGDNIPFTGSVVQTVGQSQQTTSNIEYRDIGVTLSITPKLGEGDVITLDLTEEITEALPTVNHSAAGSQIGGIQTTKTNMKTHVHVPDKHFLVLSGMIRNSKSHQKTGIPCLGGLPIIGAAFSQDHNRDEKRNVMIFVRPRIIHSVDDYKKVTESQESMHIDTSSAKQFIEDLKTSS